MLGRVTTTGLTLALMVLIACCGEASPAPDLVGTEVAVQRTAAATLTAEAPTPRGRAYAHAAGRSITPRSGTPSSSSNRTSSSETTSGCP
jgi:hypothetical protein